MLLKDKLEGYRLILASRSPRRRELLAGCDIPFTIAADYDAEEIYPEALPAMEVPVFLARLKSDAFPDPLAPGDILLTADTVVILKGKVLGKPADRADAVRMLSAMSGNVHTVVTGICLRMAEKQALFSVPTDVWLRPLAQEEINYYLDNYSPYDKAGSYGIQEWIGYVGIERIEGSFYNVMGLPVQALCTNLENLISK